MIWAISDLHLSSFRHKPMDIFGDHWREHTQRVAAAWRDRVAEDDWVLIAGDISWAMRKEEAIPDLAWIAAMPGRKILVKGNHDHWWDRVGPLRAYLPEGIIALQASAVDIGEAVVCGTRGWITPETIGFVPAHDERVYRRELGRIERALAEARQLAQGKRPIIVMLHYPPFVNRQPTEFAHRIAQAGAQACVYGHLHREADWAGAVQGVVEGVFYQLTSCDYLGFGPVAVRGIGSNRR